MIDPMYAPPRWLRGDSTFWQLVLLVSFGIGLMNLVGPTRPPLAPLQWALIGLSIAAFMALYRRYQDGRPLRPAGGTAAPVAWPRPFAQTLAYVDAQLALTLVLLRYTHSFNGPLFTLIAQIAATQPPRKWPVPIGATSILLVLYSGGYESILRGEWADLAVAALIVVIMLTIYRWITFLIGTYHKQHALMLELRQARDELEASARQAEELAALRERTRLAREMHDSLGYALVTITIKLEAAERLYAVDPARGSAELAATREVVRTAMAELRRSLNGLRQPLAEGQNLAVALSGLADEVGRRANLPVACSLPDGPVYASAEIAEAFWHVARESLANIERHAAASQASLDLGVRDGMVVLEIRDNGRGVAAHELERPGHYGIIGMRERLQAIGGSFDLISGPAGGTVVAAHAPLGLR